MMMAVTKEVFDSMLPADWPRGHTLLHEEVGWLADDRYLGVIVRDKIDDDFGYVLLRSVPVVACVHVGTSYRSVEGAREGLTKAVWVMDQ
jgi:hypothetical protein